MKSVAQRIKISGDQTTSAAKTPDIRVPGRRRITRWTKGAWTGLIAGTIAIILEMVLSQVTAADRFWNPVRLSASIALGNRAVLHSSPFTFDIFFVGLLVHYVVCVLCAVILGMIIHALKPLVAVGIGAVYGLLLYGLSFYGVALLYPWIARDRGWVFLLGHVTFGVAAAWIYNQLHMRQIMRESGLGN